MTICVSEFQIAFCFTTKFFEVNCSFGLGVLIYHLIIVSLFIIKFLSLFHPQFLPYFFHLIVSLTLLIALLIFIYNNLFLFLTIPIFVHIINMYLHIYTSSHYQQMLIFNFFQFPWILVSFLNYRPCQIIEKLFLLFLSFLLIIND